MIINDDFTKIKSLKGTSWHHQTGGHGFGNKELQYYTDKSTNLYFDSEGMHLKAIKEDYDKNHYTSCKIVSDVLFQYGKITITFSLPKIKGAWPAIWMLGEEIQKTHKWPSCGEIDIMEYVGRMPNVMHVSLHDEDFNHTKGNHRTYLYNLNEQKYHTLVFNWTSQGFSMTIDDVFVDLFKKPMIANHNNWNFDQPFFLMINLAIGGYFGGEVDPNFSECEFVIQKIMVEEI